MKKKASYFPLFQDKEDLFSGLMERAALSHAYLFFGDEGVGKRTFAARFARFVETGAWEGETPLIDVRVIAPDEEGTLSVDTMRAMKNFLSQTPLRSPRRVVIVESAEALTPEAQGACLKIVEEPPSSALMIFLAHSPEAFFPPLASRMLKIYFPRLPRVTIETLLKEQYDVPPAKAKAAAEKSYGRIGRALALTAEKKRRAAEDLPERIEAKILELREHDVVKNSALLAKLLRMEESVKRYNVNKRLQTKALEYLLRA